MGAYRGYKLPKKKGDGEDQGMSFTLGAVFEPGASKLNDFDAVEKSRVSNPKPPQ